MAVAILAVVSSSSASRPAAAAAAASAEALVACAPPRVAQIPRREAEREGAAALRGADDGEPLARSDARRDRGPALRRAPSSVIAEARSRPLGIARSVLPGPAASPGQGAAADHGVADSSGSGHDHGHGLVATMGGFGQVFMDEADRPGGRGDARGTTRRATRTDRCRSCKRWRRNMACARAGSVRSRAPPRPIVCSRMRARRAAPPRRARTTRGSAAR